MSGCVTAVAGDGWHHRTTFDFRQEGARTAVLYEYEYEYPARSRGRAHKGQTTNMRNTDSYEVLLYQVCITPFDKNSSRLMEFGTDRLLLRDLKFESAEFHSSSSCSTAVALGELSNFKKYFENIIQDN